MLQPVCSDIEPVLLEMHIETGGNPLNSCAALLAGCVACTGDQIQAFELFLVISFCNKNVLECHNVCTL